MKGVKRERLQASQSGAITAPADFSFKTIGQWR